TVQRGMIARNASVPDELRIVFRVGINIGDIIIDGNDIFGDGVNIAARLETLCEPGGLCLSGMARDQVGSKLPLTFADLGEHSVKNIAQPVRAFGLSPEAIAATPELALGRERKRAPVPHAWIAGGAALIALVAGAAGWWTLRSPTPAPSTAAVPAGPDALNAQRASIAVLPFVSLSDPSKDDYFADGLTEDIISALGRFSNLSVRSRNAVFPYKGKTPKPDEIGRDLQVRYLVEGSIRRSPERLRILVRLTDASRGALLWSEQYDPEPKDIFQVQDDITRRVAGSLAVRLTSLEIANAVTKPPNDLAVYDLVLRGRDMYARFTRSGNSQAREMFERAIALDPTYVPAYVGLGLVDASAVAQGWSTDSAAALQRAEDLGRKALALDEGHSGAYGAYALLGRVYIRRGDYDRALDVFKRALALNASDADSYAGLGNALLWTGHIEDAIKALETAQQFQPNIGPTEAFYLGIAYLVAGRSADSIRTLERAIARYSNILAINVTLAAAYAEAERSNDATTQAELVRRQFPFFDSTQFGSQFRNPEHRKKIAGALEKAGL
ncbi:MAG: adenylate cyclase, partial [Alphaproteobacteria bacterium]|nr:adenylate cyclase [Alphaproteobacteria bacterium]